MLWTCCKANNFNQKLENQLLKLNEKLLLFHLFQGFMGFSIYCILVITEFHLGLGFWTLKNL